MNQNLEIISYKYNLIKLIKSNKCVPETRDLISNILLAKDLEELDYWFYKYKLLLIQKRIYVRSNNKFWIKLINNQLMYLYNSNYHES